jgi:hypothetical protein
MRKIILFTASLCLLAQPSLGQEPQHKLLPLRDGKNISKDSIKGKMNEEANRHELLNASTFQSPRQIQIGLPITDPGDFLVAENDVPVVYANMPQGPQSVWRPGDGAYAKVYMMSLTETLLGYGRVGYGTNSYLQNGIEPVMDITNPGPPQAPRGFSGLFNYRVNSYGKQQFDLTVSSPLGKGWYAAFSTYQNFDPGYFKLPFNSMNNRLQIYRGSLTKKFNRGDITLAYRYANTRDLFPVTSISPFLYNGTGKSISHVDGVDWGTDFFGNPTGNFTYKNIKTGQLETTSYQDAAKNSSHNVMLNLHYNFTDKLKLKFSSRWNYVPNASVPLQVCTSTEDLENSTSGTSYYTDNTGSATTSARYVQQWMAMINHAFINDAMFRTELSHEGHTNKWIAGMENIFHYENHDVSSYMYNTSIGPTQQLLYTQLATGGSVADVSNINPMAYNAFYLYNVAGSYYKGHEDRNALYVQDVWQVRPNLKIDGGFRLDYIDIGGKSLPYSFAPGGYMGGKATDADGNEVTAELKPFSHSYWLPSLAVHVNYNILRNFGLLGEFSYSKTGSNLNTFGSNLATLPTEEQAKAQSVKYGRAGVFYNSPLVELVAVMTYIEKPKILQGLNTVYEGAALNVLQQYGIRTLGATVDMVWHPFIKGLDFHVLVQYMKPEYRDFSITLNDAAFGGAANNPMGAGVSKTFNYSGNNVVGVPNWTIEMDPSYMFGKGKYRLWASFRYYSKTYGSIMNSVEFQSHWESFLGADWHVNRLLTLGCNIENLLNQSGLTGAVGGSEFLTKEDVNNMVQKQGGLPMTGNYLRPFTFNITAQFKF